MQNFITFFEELNTAEKLLWVLVSMSIFWMIENAFPLFKPTYRKWKHAQVNLVLLASTMIINALFGIVTVGIFIWSKEHSFGLLYLVELPLWVELLLGMMLLDLVAQYFVHFLLHQVKPMWKFHMVHHSDTFVDVTSGTRHHPGDYIFREVFSLIAILIGGIPFGFYMVYRITTIVFTYWTHSNWKMPSGLDKFLSYLFVTPNVHKFHHHFERPWTDSNYGNILSIWDRLFGTFVYDNPQKIKYGLDVLDDERSDDLGYQLKIPFVIEN